MTNELRAECREFDQMLAIREALQHARHMTPPPPKRSWHLEQPLVRGEHIEMKHEVMV